MATKTMMVRQTKWISKRAAEEVAKRWKSRFPKSFFQVKQNGSKYAVFARTKMKGAKK